MKRVFGILFLLVFAMGGVFFACSNNEENPAVSSNSSGPGHSSNSSNPPAVVSSSSNNSAGDYSSSATDNNPSSSSSSLANSSPATASSSSAATTPSSSSPVGTSSAVASSSSKAVSSSAVAQSPCVQPQNSVPPGGITSCIIVNGKCYTCNPDRGSECNQGWIWNGGNASGDTYWYKEVDCKGSTGPTPGTSSAGTTTSSNSGGGTSSNSGNSGTPSYTPTAPGNQNGQTTQYWDACKPSCSWSTNAGGKPANACNITGSRIGHNDMDKSACEGGTAFACMNQAPWKVGKVSFGYVAVNDGKCGDCYQLDFPNGEVMVAMKTNIGGINGKFDIMIPGGGVGDFDALTRQVQNSGISNPDLGERRGGFRLKCKNDVNCVKRMCEETFKNLPDLKAGCLWYVNTLGNSPSSFDNPNVKYKQVDCPKELTDRY